jgi:transposase InsO family protein
VQVSDLTHVSTWQGWLYMAFLLDIYVGRIVGWRDSRSMQTESVLEALEQVLYHRHLAGRTFTHPSERSSQ